MSSIVEESCVQELTNRLVFEALAEVGISRHQVTDDHKDILYSLLAEHHRLAGVPSEQRYDLIKRAIDTYVNG